MHDEGGREPEISFEGVTHYLGSTPAFGQWRVGCLGTLSDYDLYLYAILRWQGV